MARKTFTSTAVKVRWNNRHYDRLSLFVKKGEKEKIMAFAQSQGTTLNQLLNDVIRTLLNVPQEDWKPQGVEPISK